MADDVEQRTAQALEGVMAALGAVDRRLKSLEDRLDHLPNEAGLATAEARIRELIAVVEALGNGRVGPELGASDRVAEMLSDEFTEFAVVVRSALDGVVATIRRDLAHIPDALADHRQASSAELRAALAQLKASVVVDDPTPSASELDPIAVPPPPADLGVDTDSARGPEVETDGSEGSGDEEAMVEVAEHDGRG